MVRRNAFVALGGHSKGMPTSVFGGTLAVLVALRVYSVLCLVLAATGLFLDPSTWSGSVEAGLASPFHGHLNPFGWVFQVFVSAHCVTGVALFLVCLVPLLVKKGGKAHRWFGRAFLLLWLLHLVDGLANSGQILMARGFDATRYLDVTGQGFSLYLYLQFAFISSMVIDFLANGLAAIHYKNRTPSRAMRATMVALPASSMLFGAGLAAWGGMRLLSDAPPETPNTIPFAWIFVVQVPAYLYLLAKNLRYWARATPQRWLHGWALEHRRNMMFCVQVTLYTGIANVCDRFVPQLTPIFFGLIDVGFLVWILTEERALRRLVVRSRLGLALVDCLRARREPGPALEPGDEAWVRRVFDLDGSGEIELHDAEALLRAQGIEPTAEEREALAVALDRNGDGRIDQAELAAFLAAHFTAEPTAEAELRLAFRQLDADGNGEIDLDELGRVLGRGDDALPWPAVERVLDELDQDGSGTLAWSEFVDATA